MVNEYAGAQADRVGWEAPINQLIFGIIQNLNDGKIEKANELAAQLSLLNRRIPENGSYLSILTEPARLVIEEHPSSYAAEILKGIVGPSI